MAQRDIEIILARQLASYLAVPIFLVDTEGTLIFYNEPAEAILGRRFEETGKMAVDEWTRVFQPTDEEGTPLEPGELPLVKTLQEGWPSHRVIRISGLDEEPRRIEVMSFPIVGQANRRLGAVAVFWEDEGP